MHKRQQTMEHSQVIYITTWVSISRILILCSWSWKYTKLLKLLKRHGLESRQEPKQKSPLQTNQENSKQQEEESKQQQKPTKATIAEKLNEADEEVIVLSYPWPIAAKGLLLLVVYSLLYNLRVYYFSTRMHIHVISPFGRVVIGVLHHVDSYINSKTQWFDLKDTMKYGMSYIWGVYIWNGFM